eukprot:scaffold33198_cov54-Phaeocystis_antarctica.AAC.6
MRDSIEKVRRLYSPGVGILSMVILTAALPTTALLTTAILTTAPTLPTRCWSAARRSSYS